MNWITRNWQDASVHSVVMLQDGERPEDVTVVMVSQRQEPVAQRP
jgi:hypothetical protein